MERTAGTEVLTKMEDPDDPAQRRKDLPKPVRLQKDPLEASQGILKRIAKPDHPIRVYEGATNIGYGGSPTTHFPLEVLPFFMNRSPMCVWACGTQRFPSKGDRCACTLHGIAPESEAIWDRVLNTRKLQQQSLHCIYGWQLTQKGLHHPRSSSNRPVLQR